MNILVINWRCIKNPEMGGAEVHLHEIFKRIVEKGNNVTLVAHKFAGAKDEETVDGIKIIRYGNKYLFNYQFKNFYKSQLSDNNFDLIVDDISKIPLNIPAYIDKPIVGILHHVHGNSLYKEIPFPMAFYIIQSERQIPKNYKTTPIFTVSDSTTSELVDMGFNKSLTGILYNSIDQELFNKVSVKKSSSPLISYVGRIKNYKNIDKIIDAAQILSKEIPNINLIIGGKGDYLDNLKDKVKQLKLEQIVKFTGFLSEIEKASLLGKSWLFITMAEKEGWGITVIEANAMKTPAIGSNVPGLRDSIKNGETGYLVPLNNSARLAEKIKELINDEDELTRISENAYKWSKNFSWDKSASYFLEKVYEWYPKLKP